jgi:hypothetical protein
MTRDPRGYRSLQRQNRATHGGQPYKVSVEVRGLGNQEIPTQITNFEPNATGTICSMCENFTEFKPVAPIRVQVFPFNRLISNDIKSSSSFIPVVLHYESSLPHSKPVHPFVYYSVSYPEITLAFLIELHLQ